MRRLWSVWVLVGWTCSLAQAPPQTSTAARAASLMEEAGKLGAQKTGKAMEMAIAEYRQAVPLWRELQNAELEAKALEQIGVLSLRLGDCASFGS